MAWSVNWTVSVNGTDRSDGMRPYLIDINVVDKEGGTSDTCSLTFDDADGQLRLPKPGVSLSVGLEGVTVFTGVVDTVRSSGSRGGGRLLRVTGKSFDTRGKAKQLQSFHLDDATLGEFLKKAAENAGFDLQIDPALGDLKRDYWSADSESFLDIGERVAREINGTFKLRGTAATLVERGATALPGITGRVGKGGNVLNWDISPFAGRAAYKKATAKYFDRKKAAFESVDLEIEDAPDDIDTSNIVRMNVADKEQAVLRTKGRKSEAKRDAGDGKVELDITPDTQAEAVLTLTGARPGIDGTYRITGVTHKASRTGGATTSLDLGEPGGGAGKDDRGEDGADVADPDDIEDLPDVRGLS